MKIKIYLLILSFSFLSPGFTIAQGNKLSTEQWSQDIDSLLINMPKVHIDPYHNTSKTEFRNFADDLKSRLPSMTDNQIITELARMIAMIGDGHTVMSISNMHNQNLQSSVFKFHIYPVKFYIFNEGVYVIPFEGVNNDLTGMKVLKINNVNIETVIEKIKPVVPRDNDYTIKFELPLYILIPEYLNGLGLCPDNFKSDFTFEDKNGNQITRSLEPVGINEYNESVDVHRFSESSPLYLQNDEKNYWFKYLDDSKILYINYKRVLIDPSDSLKYFCNRLEEFITTHDIEKTIIDIRNNGGGNNGTCQPFVDLISNNEKVNKKGKLFTVIGRQTFSAASYLTTKLEFNTNTTFIGEPTGAKPNHYGDNRPLILPNSGLTIRLSSIYWKNSFPFDNREFTDPEIKVDISAKDFFENRDPVLEAVLNYDYPESNFQNISSEDIKTLTGKYLIEPLQYMEIKEDGEDLILEVRKPDFIGRDVTYIHTPVYSSLDKTFTTGINGFKISQINNGVKLSYREHHWDIQKTDNNYKMPVQLFREGKYEEANNLLREVKNQYPENENVTESAINNLGYIFVNDKNLEAAIEVFKLNVEFYPDAFNTYDSLGEAYLMTGNQELAIINYKKSVELNQRNENGKKILDKLTSK